jgi:hypothetical protein
LKARWKLLLVFACTGTTVVLIKGLVFDLLGVTSFWPRIALILVLYHILLVIYAALFGELGWLRRKFLRR